MVEEKKPSVFNTQFDFLVKKIMPWLTNPNVTEIMVNPGGQVWVDELGKDMVFVGVTLLPNEIESIISMVASKAKTTVTRDNPIISAELPDGSRFEGLIPPIVETPAFSIRKHASMVFTFDDYVSKGILQEDHKKYFEETVKERKNVLVVGGTGSGKTTLCNAFIHAISNLTPDHRVITIEDTRELQVTSPNIVGLRTSDNIDMTRLLKSCMRLRPDRILVGEVRGPEALALLKAWNTGHPGGLATIHANSAESGLTRLEQLLQEAGIPQHASKPIIAEAINTVVFIGRTKMGRRISAILNVNGLVSGEYSVSYIYKGPEEPKH
jgi:type IV secretion system protein VirB11